jgi:hypothetical protein
MTDLDTIIEQLEKWKVGIDNAIASVTALRGIEAIVPPSSAAPVKQAAATKKATKKRVISPEGRKKISEASRKRWANVKKAAPAATKKTVKKKAKAA